MKRKIVAMLLSFAMGTALLSGCGSTETETSDQSGTKNVESSSNKSDNSNNLSNESTSNSDYSGLHLEIVSQGLQHAYWQAVLKGCTNKAQELGVEFNFIGPDSESNIQQQVTQLESAIAANPDAIGLAALDTDSVIDLLETASDSGIPIIGFDSGVPDAPEGVVVANCSTDNYIAGELAADMVWEAISKKVEESDGSVRIGVVAQDSTQESIVNRGLGFIDRLGELGIKAGYTVGMSSVSNERYVTDSAYEVDDSADIIIEVRVPASITSELSAADATAILQQNDTIAIYASNEHSANALITANENLNVLGTGDGQIIAAGFDSGEAQLNAVRDGLFLGSITQAPVAIGEYLIEIMCKVAVGEDVEDVDTGCQWYTADNMDDEEIAQNLYE